MKRVLIALISLVISTTVHSYTGTPQDQTDAFFKDLVSNKTSQAIDNLFSSNPMVSQKIQQITMMKQQVGSVAPLYGKLLGSEVLKKEELSPSLIRLVYLAKHEHHPLVWEFYFYKPKSNWIISNATFGDQFQYVGSKK